MTSFRRTIALMLVALVLLTTFAPGLSLRAQDSNTVTADGSALVAKVIEAAKTAYLVTAPEAKIEIAVSGTEGGFEKFCEGSLDLALAYGAISDQAAAACAAKNVQFTELLLGYDAAVVAVNSTSPARCLSLDQFNILLSPSASGVNQWASVDSTLGEGAISTVLAPPEDAQTRFLFDRLIAGEGLRADLTVVATPAEMISQISADIAAVGLMTLADFNANTDGKTTRALQVRSGTACIDANALNIDEARYPAVESLYVYVNLASLDRQPVVDFLNFVLGAEGKKQVTSSGYSVAGSLLYDRGREYVSAKRAGRTFSRIQRLNISADQTGSITVGGSSTVHALLSKVNGAFTPRFSGIAINLTTYDSANALADLCAGIADVVGVSRKATDAELAICQSADIAPIQLTLGSEALVLAVNSTNTFAQCLTLDEVNKVFNAKTAPKKWSEVKDGFPETDLMPVLPSVGAMENDLLLVRVAKDQIAPIMREDGVKNDDALFRAAGVQNVDGGITFLKYSDFKKSSSKVNVVKIDGGNGCVEPTEATISDGTYAFSYPNYLLVNPKSFVRPEMRAYTWFLLSDDTLTLLNSSGLTGTDTVGITGLRDGVLDLFEKAETPAATATPSAETPVPTAETPAETPAPTVETPTPTVETLAPTAETPAPSATPGN